MKFDVAVIGGGPAGMIAAGRAGELGASVILVEKNRQLGKKLLMTGGNRCNLTNNSTAENIMKRIGKNGKFLFSALSVFGPVEVMDFFEKKGVAVKIEEDNKVFPKSNKALDILDALLMYLGENKIRIKTNSSVSKIFSKNNHIEKIILSDGEEILADKFILATGGKSYPITGSNGDGFLWLSELGHSIVKPIPSLVPVVVKEKFCKKLEGLSLKNIVISLYKNNQKIKTGEGDIIFTKNGISGPLIIEMSKIISQSLSSKTEISLDFFPSLSHIELDKKIQVLFQKNIKKLFKNSLEKMLPPKLLPIIMELSQIDSEKKVTLITKKERKKITQLLKEFPFEIIGVCGFEKAIITSGGVSLKEIHSKTMQSRIIDNLYFAGEIIDLDGPTGGYNLQICWSTGYMAGTNVKTGKDII